MNEPSWTKVMSVDELAAERARVIKIEGKQIALFRLDAGDIHAIDNRCPHEGYPLSTGALKEGVLTCEWHNWKFRLCDGACILGGEDVRHYPLRIEDGAIWLDLAEPDPDAQVPALYRSLEDAFDDADWGQAGRAIERLLAAGQAPARILGMGCDWGATHAPYGFDHGLAATADLAALLDDFAAEPGVPLLEAMNLMVEPNLRRPARALPAAEPVDVASWPGGWDGVGRTLRQRIEDEDVDGAEALVRGALEAGAGPARVLDWLTHAATDHFLDFGHAQIYCVKAEELIERIGHAHAHPVLTSVASRIAYGTREDRLPYMRAYGRVIARYTDRLARWAESAPNPARAPDVDALLAAVLDGDLADALDAVAAELDRRVVPHRIALVLGLAASHRLMRFDHRLEHREDISEDWLHATHTMTHADAVRESLRRRPGMETLRGLFHSARFVQHLAPCDLPPDERVVLPQRAAHARTPGTREILDSSADHALLQALRAHDAAGAMATMRDGFAPGGDRSATELALRRYVVTDSASIPIFVAHHVKTSMAALRLTHALGQDEALSQRDDADLPVVAAARFIAHPLRERRIAIRARVSRDFVVNGRRQPALLGY